VLTEAHDTDSGLERGRNAHRDHNGVEPSLVRTIPDVRYEPQRSITLKGLDSRVDLVKVRPVGEDLAASFRGLLVQARARGQPRRARRPWVWLAAGLAAIGGIAGVLALTSERGAPRLDTRGGVGQLEVESSRLVAAIDAPSGAVAVAPDGIWVADPGGHSVAKLDSDVGSSGRNRWRGSGPGELDVRLPRAVGGKRR
jgi:hypothetical protein